MKQSKKSKKHRYSSSPESSYSQRSRSYSSKSSSSSDRKQRKNKNKHKDKKKHKQRNKQRKRSRSYDKQRQKDKQRARQRSRQKDTQKGKHYQAQRKSSKYNNLKQQQDQITQKYQQRNTQKPKLDSNTWPKKQQHQSPSRNEEQFPQQQQQTKIQKQLPCFEPSGILLQFYNARQGVSLRFHQPPQSRQPDQQWRMYIFKGEQVLSNFLSYHKEPIILTKSCYLIGKDQRVVDILAQNPSISRQHCVIQFRLVQKRQTQGEYIEMIKPYVMDLESTNGTILNDEKIQPGRYYELLHKDVLKFGFSDRQYVMVKWDQTQQQQQEQ